MPPGLATPADTANGQDVDDQDYISTVPFTELPQFSRGLSRHPIKFIPAGTLPSTIPTPAVEGPSIADAYLSIVFPNGRPATPSEYPICSVCNLPKKEGSDAKHHLSLGHQMALPRAPTPSGIDRTRMGLKYMEKHGFDVDSRRGLGATQQGMLYPIQPVEKADKLGIGLNAGQKVKVQEVQEVRLGAGEMRKKVLLEKKKAERLRKEFYGDEKVEKYLGRLEQAGGAGIMVDWPQKNGGKKRKR
ncbi:hypothetical protein BDV96DRAFT_565273 [Lophiotrema nucula]|uniref:G-patch domain-containing protein n=1 Tax=Lophiotrema nucula TaxID=690887 RepID=A0A6A5ZQW8_9PLEO|nr:hypothetical protein BDV96DRAFT_565273 [Lophiotrema nucula]